MCFVIHITFNFGLITIQKLMILTCFSFNIVKKKKKKTRILPNPRLMVLINLSNTIKTNRDFIIRSRTSEASSSICDRLMCSENYKFVKLNMDFNQSGIYFNE